LVRESRSQGLEGSSSSDLGPVQVEAAPIRQKVTAALRRAIELGTLQAGDRLVEKDLCARLNVSRSSLREAFRDLEVSGLVTNLASRGLIVASLSLEDILGIYRVRAAIELMLAAEFVKNADEEDIAELKAVVKQMKTATTLQAATLDAHRAFYEVWCRGAGNPFALEVMRNIQLRLSIIRSKTLTPSFLRKNAEGRAEIVESMTRRDTAGAQRLIRSHITFAANAALQAAGFPKVDVISSSP